MWVIDTGRINGEYVCPAQLLAFDLHKNELIFRKKIPPNVAQDKYGNGLLFSLAVETHELYCNNTNVSILTWVFFKLSISFRHLFIIV